eukprot:gene17667-6362_t
MLLPAQFTAAAAAAALAPVAGDVDGGGGWKNMTTFHVIDPMYTGIRNKNSGDFKGDYTFIIGTINRKNTPGTEGANFTVLEQVLVEVNGGFSKYAHCNVGA